MTPQEYTATVTTTKYLSPKVIWIVATSNEEIPFIPGQYASLFVGSDQQRLYSFATPTSLPHLEFIIDISPNGPGSKYVQNIKLNDQIRFLAPFGHFKLDLKSPRPLLFIATGAGIAPLRAHIKQLLQLEDKRPITLVFGNKDENNIILHNEFIDMQEKYDNFSYLPVCSDPASTWSGLRGLVTDIISSQLSNLSDYNSYICGSSPMVLSTMTVLRQKGVPDQQIHMENYT